jgi:hypothetical protein
LFPDIFQGVFHVHHRPAHFKHRGFGTDGVYFPVDLLTEKIEFFSGAGVAPRFGAEFGQVGGEAGNFLGDAVLHQQYCGFRQDAVFVDLVPQKFGETAPQIFPDGRFQRRGLGGHGL